MSVELPDADKVGTFTKAEVALAMALATFALIETIVGSSEVGA